MKRIDLVGRRFTRLLVVADASLQDGKARWRCRCDCGGETVSLAGNLLQGKSRSCGCLRKERTRELHPRTHGMYGTPTYITWSNMKQRCHYPKDRYYKLYGGSGIFVCKRWRESFEAFLEDMGVRPVGATIDRIDNSKGYEPGNCRWSPQVAQERNKRNNRKALYKGKQRSLAEIAEMSGVKYQLLYDRFVRYGWSLQEALAEK